MDYASLLVAACIWGGNAVVSKASASVIGAVAMAFYRWALALALLSPFVVRGLVANRREIRTQIPRLVALGVLGFAAFPALMYLSARYTSAMHIGIIQALMPLLVLGISTALLRHRPTPGMLGGGAISLAGVALVVSHGDPGVLFGHAPNLGDGLMLAATACYALYVVLLKQWQSPIALPQSLYVQAGSAMLFLLPIFLFSRGRTLDSHNLPLIAYAGGLASIVAPLAWMHGIRRVGPARASLFFNLVPVVTAVLASSVLAERLTGSLVLGGAMTIGGVMIAEFRPRRRAGESA